MKITIKGTSPHIQFNGDTINPLNKYAKELRSIEDRDSERFREVQFRGSLYLNAEKQIVIPTYCIEAGLVEAAKQQKLGSAFLKSVKAETDSILDFPDKDKDIETLFGAYAFSSKASFGPTRKVVRTGAIFKEWGAILDVSYDVNIINEKDLLDATRYLGSHVGLSSWRPKYGLFTVESWS